MTAQNALPGGRQRGWWIPWLFVGLFGVVLAANGTMLYFAMSSFTGLHTEGHYQKGLNYNRVLGAAQAQEALGWTISVLFEPSVGSSGRLVVRAAGQDGTPLTGALVTARLMRPTQAGFDMDVTFVPSTGGIYAADIDLPLPGQWEVRARIDHRAGVYRATRRIMVR